MAFINFLSALYEFIIFLLLFCRALTEDFESEPELRRIFRKARVTVRVELRSQLQVWSLFLHFSLPFSTMDGFLKTATVKTTPSFSSMAWTGTKHFKAIIQIRKWSQIVKDYLKDFSQTPQGNLCPPRNSIIHHFPYIPVTLIKCYVRFDT